MEKRNRRGKGRRDEKGEEDKRRDEGPPAPAASP
jgi:hypothetical protein